MSSSKSDVVDEQGKESQSMNVSWPWEARHRISLHAVSRPPFARTTTFESASSAAKALEAAREPEPRTRVVLFGNRKASTSEAPPCGEGNVRESCEMLRIDVGFW